MKKDPKQIELGRKKGLEIALYVLLGFVAGVAANEAEGYELNGVKWGSTYHISAGYGCPEFFLDLLAETLEATAPVDYAINGSWSGGLNQDSVNNVYCSDVEPAALSAISKGNIGIGEDFVYGEGLAVLGKARWRYDLDTNHFVECDIWLHSGLMETVREYETFLNHELGHCYGMGHSYDYQANMYWAPFSHRFTVDDWAGLSKIYSLCTPKVDYMGNVFIPKLDATEFREDEFLSAYLRVVGEEITAYNIEISECGL